MKNLLFVSVSFIFFTGTSLSATAQHSLNAVRSNDGIEAKPIKFIEGIEIKGGGDMATVAPVQHLKNSQPTTPVLNIKATGQIEKSTAIQFKYAQLLNKEVERITNIPLYSFIDDWMDTRYRYGGTTKKGIDCSAFTSQLVNNVYAVNLPRTAREQYNNCLKIGADELVEGDLLFFNTRGGVSHVAVYLGDHYFVHASTSNGVMISSLDDTYYSNRFIGGGRIPCAANDVVKTATCPQECND